MRFVIRCLGLAALLALPVSAAFAQATDDDARAAFQVLRQTPSPLATFYSQRLSDEVFTKRHERGEDALIREFKREADHDDADADYWLGEAYLRAPSLQKDTAKATTWLTRAANGGNATAVLELAYLAQRAGDYARAYGWLVVAAKAGSPQARDLLRDVYSADPSVTTFAQLIAGLKSQTDARATFALCRVYAEGIGLPADLASAMTYCQQAAIGDATAKAYLGTLYLHQGEEIGTKEGLPQLQASAEQGNARGELFYGQALHVLVIAGGPSQSVEANTADHKAYDWMEKAADQGLIDAQFALCSAALTPMEPPPALVRREDYKWCRVLTRLPYFRESVAGMETFYVNGFGFAFGDDEKQTYEQQAQDWLSRHPAEIAPWKPAG